MLRLQTANPSLPDSAANILFRFTFNLELFELSADTTYDLYLYAVGSDRVSRRTTRVSIHPYHVWFRKAWSLTSSSLFGWWRFVAGACTNTFCSPIKAIATLVDLRNCCGVISVSNRYSFPKIVIYINTPLLYWAPWVRWCYLFIIVVTDVKGYQTYPDDGFWYVSLATRHAWPKGERHFALTVVEGLREEFYVLLLDYFFAQNEIMINNRSMYLDVISRGINAGCKPILVLNKRYN